MWGDYSDLVAERELIRVRPKPERVAALEAPYTAVLRKGAISSGEAVSLAGRLLHNSYAYVGRVGTRPHGSDTKGVGEAQSSSVAHAPSTGGAGNSLGNEQTNVLHGRGGRL